MPPSRVALISTNLKRLTAAVDRAAASQPVTVVAPAAGKRTKASKKTRRHKKK